MSGIRERLAAEMRRARHEKQLSRADVADRIGANPNSIGNIERSEQSPSIELFAKIAQLLDLNAEASLGVGDEVHEALDRQADAPPCARRLRIAQAVRFRIEQ